MTPPGLTRDTLRPHVRARRPRRGWTWSAVRSSALPLAVSAALVIPNLTTIVRGVEDFPFTVAPMFAHYVGPDTRLYAFRLEGVRDGVGEPFPVERTNWSEIKLMRGFASFFYAPLTHTSPFRDAEAATLAPERLAARLEGFFGPLTDFVRDSGGGEYDTVVLHVDVVDSSGTLLETAVVGRYDVETRSYAHVYEVSP